jgi:hypothetical protein
VYHKFLGKDLGWSGNFGGYQSPSCHKFIYNISKYDSMRIGTLLYYVMTKEKYTYPPYFTWPDAGMCNFSASPSVNFTFPGSLREDTILKKVYFLHIDSINETLIYDFSLNIGDTVKSYVTNFCAPVIVTQIDSIFIDSDYRKRWIVNGGGCLWNGEIIEGIGSNMELLEQMVNFEWGGNLGCYSVNSVTMFSQSPDCPVLITNIDKQIKVDNVTVSPNPAKNSITISQTEPKFNKYEIYSLNGKLVTESKINNILQKVDLTGYAEGMYIVKLVGNQKVEFKKIVVTE